jgi:hypothetical protein
MANDNTTVILIIVEPYIIIIEITRATIAKYYEP